MTKHSYTATFKRKDETVFTKRFLASDLFEADEPKKLQQNDYLCTDMVRGKEI